MKNIRIYLCFERAASAAREEFLFKMIDIFDKFGKFTAAKELREMDLFPYFRELESRQDVEVIMEGKRRIMLGSNNYLGLTTNPEIIEAGKKALDEYCTG